MVSIDGRCRISFDRAAQKLLEQTAIVGHALLLYDNNEHTVGVTAVTEERREHAVPLVTNRSTVRLQLPARLLAEMHVDREAVCGKCYPVHSRVIKFDGYSISVVYFKLYPE